MSPDANDGSRPAGHPCPAGPPETLPAGLRIVRATVDDTDLLCEMIRELAHFEGLEAECHITDEAVRVHLLGPHRSADALIAWLEDAPAGFAVYYRTFSTFAAKPGVFLEDLYVRERFRQRGIGRALLTTVGRLAARLGAGRFEWTALTWNHQARRLYAKLGARERSEWLLLRLEGAELGRFHCAGAGRPSASCRCGGEGPHHAAPAARD